MFMVLLSRCNSASRVHPIHVMNASDIEITVESC